MCNKLLNLIPFSFILTNNFMSNKQSPNQYHKLEYQYKFPKITHPFRDDSPTIKGIVGQAISFFTMHQPEPPKSIFEPGLKIIQYSSETSYKTEEIRREEQYRKSKKRGQLYAFQRYIKRYNNTFYPEAPFLTEQHKGGYENPFTGEKNIGKAKQKKVGLTTGSKIMKTNLTEKKNKKMDMQERQAGRKNSIFLGKIMRSESTNQQYHKKEQLNAGEQNPEGERSPLIKQIETTIKERQRNKFTIKYNHTQKKHKFYVGSGNNESLVKEVLGLRKNWQQTNEYDTLFSLRWESATNKMWYSRIQVDRFKQYVNHLQFHEQITSKCGLLKTLKKHCSRNALNCFDYIPVSFLFDCEDILKYETEMKKFVFYFCQNIPNSEIKSRKERQYVELVKNIGFSHKPNLSFEGINLQGFNPLSRPYLSQSNYLWIYKPSDENRGRGIRLFKTLQQLVEIIKVNEKETLLTSHSSPTSHPTGNSEQKIRLKSKSFVIQKYIEKPLLIDNRKFDIRVWVLMGPNGQGYFFKEGYIRTSCQQFSLSQQNQYVHLTNNAIQKNSEKYGLYEEGNQLTFDDFDKYFAESENENFIPFRQTLLVKVKEVCRMVLESSYKKLHNTKNQCCFQIFGFDYMVDFQGGLWLIQVNTNPCLQTSSKLLKTMIPRMLDDAFKLILDPVFKVRDRKQEGEFHIQGYEDDENMWQLLRNEG